MTGMQCPDQAPPGLPCGCLSARPPAQFFLEEDASGRSHGLWAPGSWSSVTFHVGSVLGDGGWGLGFPSLRTQNHWQEKDPVSWRAEHPSWSWDCVNMVGDGSAHRPPHPWGPRRLPAQGNHTHGSAHTRHPMPSEFLSTAQRPGTRARVRRGGGSGHCSQSPWAGGWMPRGVKEKQRGTWVGAGWGSGDDESGQVAVRVGSWWQS